MYYLPTSGLVLFFLFSFFQDLSCALSKNEGWCQAQFQCGNITAGFPFSGGIRPQLCGHPLLELHCYKNTTSIIISNHFYNVLHVDKKSNTLRLASAEVQGSFCNATFTATTLPPEIFEILPTYKSLNVFYLCDPNIPYRSSHSCPGRGPVSVSQNLDYQNSCKDCFTINVPKSYVPEEKELNLTQLESALREGFEVKVKIDEKACQECSSSHGICSFENTKQICCKEDSSSRCNKINLPDADELHKRCSRPFSCGDQEELFYPFWVSGREECGHPNFKLENCGGRFAELNISSVKFRILEANYDATHIIKLARSDFIDNLCPYYPVNGKFDENVLPFASDTELLTIYYDCDFSPSLSTFGENLVCGDDGDDGKTNYYVTRNLSSPLLDDIRSQLNELRGCDRNVSIPANGDALISLKRTPSPDNLKKALTDGFELRLNQECLECIHSKGACGYNLTSNKFTCYHIENKGLSSKTKAGIGAASTMVGLILIVAGIICAVISCERKTSNDLRQRNLKALIPLKHYSYAQVKRITNSFVQVVGKGGFGTVYRGTLSDGQSVAVKILKDSKGNGEDFINEVASISKTSHVNIVSLLGFCSEGSKRAIIYEYLENGSLAHFISSKTSMNMDWMALYKIALGVARGLEYLHHGCKTRIVHFDIKPQNVLLNDNLCPKVSDFGLAKLCEKKESILSLLDVRGTIGYIAPEVFSRMYGQVSHKSDVYSYGMLLLEMIGARNKERAAQNDALNTSSMYFPEWIYKDLEKGDGERIIENGINIEKEELAKKMTLVGLWCIQSSPSDRPAMNKVVEMMEGNLDALEVPPRPVFPAAPLQESSTLSENILVSIEV